jgi:Putative transmembrane protein (PGPGW)
VVSGLAFLLGALVVPLVVARLPANYLVREEPRADAGSLLGMARRVLKNVLGAVLVVAGVLMLILPGQGILTIVLGIVLLDFPGKRRLERQLIARPHVPRIVNALRARLGRAALEVPGRE